MSTLSLRLPESLHELARAVAKEEDISINQLITLALAEKLSALKTGEYFEQRAQRSSRAKFVRALSQVKKREPKEQDRLPRKHKV
jgi:HicB family